MKKQGVESINTFKIFSGTSNHKLASAIARYVGMPLGKIVVGRFPNGEIRVEIKESVRGFDVFIIQSTCPPVNDNIMELLIMIDAFKRASASSITAVMPYFGYAKQDKKKSGREPISARLIADLLERAGVNRVVTIDIHAAQIAGFFNLPMENLTAMSLFADHLKHLKNTVAVSPDAGGVKRARDLANRLNAHRIAVIDKYRPDFRKATAMNVIGKVSGFNAIIIDDFIDTGGSMKEAVEAVLNHGAKSVRIAFTHALMTPPAKERLEPLNITEIITTDTIPARGDRATSNMKILSTAAMLGDTIKRIMGKKSLRTYWPTER
ncbi:MAG: ribose-phosphate pyrophosphokinase [Candidatus Woesearchaeota archaeon]